MSRGMLLGMAAGAVVGTITGRLGLWLPIGLMVGMFVGLVLLHAFLAFAAGLGILVYLGLVLLGALGVAGSSYAVDGRPAPAGEFRAATAVMHLFGAALLALMGATAYALWRDRPWSRLALLALWLATFVIPAVWQFAATRDPVVLIPILPWSAIVLWYLYRKRSIVAYYRAVAAGDVAIST